MASTYSNLKIQLMATGENSATWGNVTNTNMGTALEEAIAGTADVPFSNASVTLTLTDANTTQTARNMRLNLTGTATAGYNLIVPAIEKAYIVNNGTDGTITVKNATGTGIAIPAGKTTWVFNNATNVVDVVTHITSLTLASALPAVSGGTGQSSYAVGDLLYASTTTALSKLADVATGNALISGGVGVAPAWGKVGLTTHVSGTLPLANGGTNATDAAGARTSLGATTIGGNVFTLTNPSAVTFPRFNADNTVSALDAATFRGAIGAGTGSGTVTSVAALTLGTTGTDLSSTVATGTTTPVITLNVPTASAANRGALSSTDWSAFNGKQAALVSGTNIKTVGGATILGSGDVGTIGATYGGTGQSSYAVGDLLYASTTTALSKLADVATGNALISGGVGVAPSWGKIGLTTHVSGTLPLANGGTNATDAAGARTNLGATTVGGNMFTLTNPSAVTFPRFNADNTVSALDAATFRTAIGAGTSSTTGTVTSVGGTGSTNGLTLSGTVNTSGNLTLGGSVTSVATGATIDGVVIGYRNIPRSTTATTAVVADNGKCIAVTAGITIPNSTFAAGDAVSIYNDSAAAITITAGVTTLRQAGTTNTGNRTLAARGMATIWFNSATEAIISGAGVT